jgi:hypothetical protein
MRERGPKCGEEERKKAGRMKRKNESIREEFRAQEVGSKQPIWRGIVQRTLSSQKDGVIMYWAGTERPLQQLSAVILPGVDAPAGTALGLQLVLWRTSGPSLGGVGGMSGPQAPSNGA